MDALADGDAVVLPRQAVSFENTVYAIKENRLHTRPVEVARVQNGKAIVVSGLEEGEQVIVTRLENPPENSLVQITEPDTGSCFHRVAGTRLGSIRSN